MRRTREVILMFENSRYPNNFLEIDLIFASKGAPGAHNGRCVCHSNRCSLAWAVFRRTAWTNFVQQTDGRKLVPPFNNQKIL